jgi:2-dehydro-3-deoxyphosphogluconate aldolase/(4S)-4-hydroxy-2-oxoglutarate aldolase
MKEIFEQARVIPVLIFPQPDYAVPTAEALLGGGLSVLEVTLRTDTAWRSLEAIVDRFPDATVGVGTVLEPEQMLRAKESGAAFAVSPGFDSMLAEAAQAAGLFYLPGVATASEVMTARRQGFRFLKFFPAEAAGGRPMLQSFASPFRDISFCPTGGVGAGNLADYLALPNVACIGGSWVATAKDMAAGDWSGIAAKAKAAREAADAV